MARFAVAGRGIARRMMIHLEAQGVDVKFGSTAVAGRGIARRLLLPMDNALKGVEGQGWLFPTKVGLSSIPGAGNGRFAQEIVPAKSKVVVKPMVPMAKIESLESLPKDRTVTFANPDDLEKYVKLGMAEGGFSRDQVMNTFENFIFGFDGRVACLNTSTWSINHSDKFEDGLNINMFQSTLDDGSQALIGEAFNDIQVGDEFYNNYRDFKLPDFYMSYCADNGFKDVRTKVLEAVDGHA
jgi:hypothetical protein